MPLRGYYTNDDIWIIDPLWPAYLTALLLRTPICSPCRGVLPAAGST